jgi:hypothetical protein
VKYTNMEVSSHALHPDTRDVLADIAFFSLHDLPYARLDYVAP